MSDDRPTPDGPASPPSDTLPGPARCLLGAVVAAALAFAMYLMVNAIAQSFAAHPVHSDNLLVHRISAAVRTLVIGIVTLGTGVFGLAAVGLFGLAIQVTIQRLRGAATDAPTP